MRNEAKRIPQHFDLIINRVNVQDLLAFILLLFFLIGTPLFGQKKGSFTIKSYAPLEYKAHVQNWATIQDDRGMIYIANGNGVLEYNGVDWRLIKVNNNTRIRSFAKDKLGRIYVGAVGEFGYLQKGSDGKTVFVSLTDKLKEEDKKFLDIWFIKVAGSDVYFSTYNTLFRLRDGEIKTWKTSENIVTCFVINEQIYVYEKSVGIKRMTEDLLSLIPFGDLLKDNSFVLALPYERNKILIGTNKNGLYIFDLDAIPTNRKELVVRKFETEADEIIKKGRPYHGIQLRDGNFAFGVISVGAVIIDKNGKLLYFIDEESGLFSGGVTDIYEDVENNLWLTQVNGISKIAINSSLSHWGDKEGLKDFVLDATRFNRSMYIGCFDGLFKLDNNQIQKISGIENIVFSFLKFNVPNHSSKQLLLAGTNFNGVIEISNDKIIPLLPSSKPVFTIVQSKINLSNLYIGKSGLLEVAVYENDRFKSLGHIDGINIEVRSIVEEKNGEVWIADNVSHVICLIPSGDILKPKQIIEYTKEDGVQGFPNLFSYNDRIIVGTSSGFYRINKAAGKFIPDSTFGKKFCDGTTRITYFKDENEGIKRISGIKNNRFGIGLQNKKGEYDWFEAPFYSIPENSFYSAYFEIDSAIWISSADGLYRFKGELTKYCPPFSTVISSATIGKDSTIYAFKNEQQLTDTNEKKSLQHKLAYKYNSILFNYKALSYYNEKLNQYQTYLEGLDKEWSDWNKDTKKEYPYLPEGHYIFHVRAKNMYGTMGEESSYEFTILPPWYKTIWAYLFYILISIAIVWLIVQLNLKRLKIANYNLEKIVQERTIDLSEVNTQLEENQAELEIRQEEITAQAELLANTNKELEKLSIVASETDSAVMIMDAETNFEWVNEGFIRMYKADLDTLRKEKGVTLLKASQNNNIQNIVTECRENKKSVIYQSYNTLKTGDGIWVQTTLTPIFDSRGEVLKFIAIDSDITKLKQAEFEITQKNQQIIAQNIELEKHRSSLEDIVQERTVELEIAKNKAEESDRLKSAFLTNMSHEIRTPMNAIIGFSSLLANDDIQSSDRTDFIKYIINNGNTLLHLIDDIIDLSKIEAGQLRISIKSFDLNKLMLELFETFNNKKSLNDSPSVNLRLSNGIEMSEFTIQTDALRIKQVLTNLVDNALKFTEEGFVEFGYVQDSGKTIKFFVKDSGIGVSKSQQGMIFNRFTKIEDDKSRLYRGTGLGLSICKSLVNLMGGEIFVESEPNEGTTFYFTIPLIKGTERDDISFSNGLIKDDYNWINKTLLIAEDEESNFQYLEMLLKSTKILILRARNGREALLLVEKKMPDLILMDIKMPIMDGVEATQLIRKENKAIPIIALSAYAFNQEIEEIKKEGFNEYLVKPTSPSKLLSLLNKYFTVK